MVTICFSDSTISPHMENVYQIYTDSPLRNYTYLVETSGGEFYCIDPWDAQQVVHRLRGSKLIGIINTHEHGDHTRGNRELVSRYNCSVFAHYNAKGKIDEVDCFLHKGEKIVLGEGAYLEVMDTPGHTFAHLSLLLVEGDHPKAVFTGDTLFNAGVGNCHNGGDPEVLYETIIHQFRGLPDEVLLYPGHEYLGNNLGFTLDRWPGNEKAKKLLEMWRKVDFREEKMVNNMKMEREINTFLRLDSQEIVDNLGGDTSTSKQVFLRLRELRDRW